MRITILQGAFLPIPPLMGGAVEKIWFQMGREFARSGHQVLHISRTYQDLPRREEIDGVTYIRVDGYNIPRNPLLLKLYDLLYSIRALFVLAPADILVTNTFFMPLLIRGIRPRYGQVVVSVERMPKGQLWFYRHVSCLRCCSSAVSQRAKSELKQFSNKLATIPNPLPFNPPPHTFVVDKQKTILYCGRIHPEKGLDLLLSAYMLACKNGLYGWSLRLVGPSSVVEGGGGDAWLNQLQSSATTNIGSIEWVGAIYSEVMLQEEYSKASIFVYPSLAEHGEAMPLAPLEAMSFGAVPVVSQLDCFKDFIIHNVNGVIFDHRSSDSIQHLASSLVELATDPARLQVLSDHALTVRQSHQPAAIATKFTKLFDTLLAQHS